MNRFEWTSPATLEQAMGSEAIPVADAMLAPPGKRPPTDTVVLKAGGIDLLDLMKAGLLTPRRVVGLRALPDMDVIAVEREGGACISALATLAQIGAHPMLRKRYRALADAAASSASPQLRHAATIGGNLLQRPRCWYFRSEYHHCLRKGGSYCFAIPGENQYHAIFDNHICPIVHPSTSATALVALGSRLELASREGKREVALEELFVPPGTDVQRENDLRAGEILTAVLLPAVPDSLRSVHLRQSEKQAFDWPLADVAVVLDLDGGRCRRASIVLGAAAPVPWRAKAAEAALTGKAVTEETARAAGRAAVADATPLSKNGYKLPMFEALVRRAVLEASHI